MSLLLRLALAREKRQALAFDANVDDGALPKCGVQAALDGFQALRDAGMIALIKAHGADEHLKGAKKMSDEEIDAAGGGRPRARSLRYRCVGERRRRLTRGVRRRRRRMTRLCHSL